MVRLLILAACAAIALADVTFNVIGLREDNVDEFGVLINGKVIKLQTSKEAYPVWSANVAGVNAPLQYQYVRITKKGEVKEGKPRKLPNGAVKTPNEYFDRPNTLQNLPVLPQVFDSNWVRNSPFFRDGYIGNLFLEGDQKAWNYINSGGDKWWKPKPVQVKVQYIGANENVKVNGAMIELSGGQTRSYSKLPYKFKFPDGHTLLDIDVLKLRSAETDPTMIREKLYIDILNALGVPAPQATYVRLFFNGAPVGLYIAEEIMKDHWVKAVIHAGNATAKVGSLWKMDADDGFTADLLYKGNNADTYKFGHIYKPLSPGSNPKKDPMHDLIKFMADIKDFDPKNEKDPLGYWEKRLDLDVFLRSMAMEYLSGFWDGYWTSGSNYQMYNNPVTNHWTWLPIDYDDTFGSSYSSEPGPYRQFRMKGQSVLVQKLILQSPQLNARFEAILKDIVNYVFKPQALLPRVAAYKTMILEDVKWDRGLTRLNNGESEDFTIQDLTSGVANGRKSSLKGWIEARTASVEKDLKFKVLAGTPSKVPPHVVTKLQSAYGIIDKVGNSTAKEEVRPAATVETKDTDGDITGTTPIQTETTVNSALSLKSEWSTLVAMVALILLAL